jgi:hypothetical protein
MVTRTAFEATLVIGNETSDAIEDVLVEIDVLDEAGTPSNHLFAGLTSPTLTGYSNGGVDGTGDILGETTATARWLLVPTEFAAPGSTPVTYTVGGRIRHRHDGIDHEIPLYPVEIDVHPDAKLFLDYYLQRIVYSDHPFTPEVEEAEPFSLGLLVRNTGFGPARNLRITSSQPEITDNDRELLIAFQILGAQLGDQAIDPSLTVNFGNLEAGQNALARWLLTSSLQGRFTCIDVDFEHRTDFGNDAVSLIKDADIYWQTHTVELASPLLPAALAYLDDGLPDFLVEIDRSQPLPDDGDEPVCGGSGLDDVEQPGEVHSSEGSRLTVVTGAMVEQAEAPSLEDLTVGATVTITTPGWNYLRFPDHGRYSGELAAPAGRARSNPPAGSPRQGRSFGVDPGLELVRIDRWREKTRVRRVGGPPPLVSYPVGGPGDIGNAWRTTRKLPVDDVPTTIESSVHFFDYFETAGEYGLVLHYRPRPLALVPSGRLVSLRAGGTVSFDVDAGPAHAGEPYAVLGSTLEPLAGLPWGSTYLPLRPDAYTRAIADGKAERFLRNARGTLDARGRARVDLVIPAASRLLNPGGRVYHALVLGEGRTALASEAVETTFLP